MPLTLGLIVAGIVFVLVLIVAVLAEGYAQHLGRPVDQGTRWWVVAVVAVVAALLVWLLVEGAWSVLFAGIAAIRS